MGDATTPRDFRWLQIFTHYYYYYLYICRRVYIQVEHW